MERISENTKAKRKEWTSAGLAVLAVAFVYLFFHVVGIGCPIQFFTGVSCPGCGMTRAALAVLRGDFAAALSFHPLVFALPAAAFVFLLRRKMPVKIYKILTFTLIGLFVILYLIRMCDPGNDVVRFRPERGFFPRVFKIFLYGKGG